MKTTLHFLQPINKVTGLDSFDIDAATYEDIISAIKALFPSVLKQFKNLFIVDNGRLITSDILKFAIKSSSVFIGPMISGSNASMDSLGNLRIFYGTSSSLSNQAVALTGLAKRVTESSLFGQGKTAFDTAQRKSARADGTLEGNEDPTTGFGSISSTSGIGLPVPLHFGMVRTSGAVINNFIKHIQRGGIDNIRVADYI
jgi:hypothetical protein